MRRVVALLAVLALPLAAADARRSDDKDPFAGRVAGTPERCVPLRQNEGLTIAADGVLTYRYSAARLYRATTIGACNGLRPFNALIVDVYGGTLCENDRFRVLQTGTSIPGPYCRLGKFIPYTRR